MTTLDRSVFSRANRQKVGFSKHSSTMTSSNPLFGFVQSRAKSVREIAASRIREAAKKVDEKLKAVEDNLEK